MLDHLAARVAQQLGRDGGQAVDVGNNQRRLEEGPGKVFAGFQVYGGLPPTDESTIARSDVGTWTT